MDTIRDQFSNNLASKLSANLRRLSPNQDGFNTLLGVDSLKASSLLDRITMALPDCLFSLDESGRQQLQVEIVDELIFFLVQEDSTKPNFSTVFSAFIHHLIDDLTIKHFGGGVNHAV